MAQAILSQVQSTKADARLPRCFHMKAKLAWLALRLCSSAGAAAVPDDEALARPFQHDEAALLQLSAGYPPRNFKKLGINDSMLELMVSKGFAALRAQPNPPFGTDVAMVMVDRFVKDMFSCWARFYAKYSKNKNLEVFALDNETVTFLASWQKKYPGRVNIHPMVDPGGASLAQTGHNVGLQSQGIVDGGMPGKWYSHTFWNATASLLSQGKNVLHVDADAFWVEDAWGLVNSESWELFGTPGARVSDIVAAEDTWGHSAFPGMPGLNSGFLYFRSTAAARKVVDGLIGMNQHPPRNLRNHFDQVMMCQYLSELKGGCSFPEAGPGIRHGQCGSVKISILPEWPIRRNAASAQGSNLFVAHGCVAGRPALTKELCGRDLSYPDESHRSYYVKATGKTP